MDAAAASNGHGLTAWNAVLGAALRVPGARVDRAAFLRSALRARASAALVEQAIAEAPAKAGVPSEDICRACDAAIKLHRAGVTATSALAGLPGGWWIAGTLPADLVQYVWHAIVLLQKLAYLHGWSELFKEEEKLDEETKLLLTRFLGVMTGAESATQSLTKFGGAAAKEACRRLTRAPLTKYASYQTAKQAAKWIGVSLTKKQFAKLVGRVVPFVGGAAAGTATWNLFGTGATRLHLHLQRSPHASHT
jgi:hypothetical protein